MERPPMGPPPADGPKPVIPDCAAFGIPKESICAFAPAALDGEGGFRLSYLLLTEDEIVRLTEPEGIRRVDFTDKNAALLPSPDCAVDRFPLAECGAVTVEPQVASVVVTFAVVAVVIVLPFSSVVVTAAFESEVTYSSCSRAR